MRILVVDDEAEVVDLMKDFILRMRHSVDVALNGSEALNLIQTNKYDLIFVDYNMPDKTGLELVNYIKQNNLNVHTVIITGYPVMHEGFAKFVGANEYLEKPLNLKTIEKIINKYQSMTPNIETGSKED